VSKAGPTTYKTLVNEKYTQEYKLDRKTRQKAEEILKEYFKKNPQECLTVSSRLLSFLNKTKKHSKQLPRFHSFPLFLAEHRNSSIQSLLEHTWPYQVQHEHRF